MIAVPGQAKSSEWQAQWTLFEDDERFLFDEWIRPFTIAGFRGQSVLELGCGGGQHTCYVAEVAQSVTAVDLNTVDIARERTRRFGNVELVEADIMSLDLGRTFETLYRHCRPGGTLIVWTYSAEGNALVRHVVEPIRKHVLRYLPRRILYSISTVLTAALYPAVHTVYRLEALRFLPYFEYFRNFRRLRFDRNRLNVFDKLNAPQTRFTTAETCRRWLDPSRFDPASLSIRRYAGVSYSLVARRREG